MHLYIYQKFTYTNLCVHMYISTLTYAHIYVCNIYIYICMYSRMRFNSLCRTVAVGEELSFT